MLYRCILAPVDPEPRLALLLKLIPPLLPSLLPSLPRSPPFSSRRSRFTDTSCINEAMKTAGVDHKKIESCMEDAGGVRREGGREGGREGRRWV